MKIKYSQENRVCQTKHMTEYNKMLFKESFFYFCCSSLKLGLPCMYVCSMGWGSQNFSTIEKILLKHSWLLGMFACQLAFIPPHLDYFSLCIFWDNTTPIPDGVVVGQSDRHLNDRNVYSHYSELVILRDNVWPLDCPTWQLIHSDIESLYVRFVGFVLPNCYLSTFRLIARMDRREKKRKKKGTKWENVFVLVLHVFHACMNLRGVRSLDFLLIRQNFCVANSINVPNT